jgi:hypothetical protein
MKFNRLALLLHSHPFPCSRAVLPDGLFLKQKSQFGKILEVLSLDNVDIFYGHLESFTDIWDIL